jgi:hypothetical protein
MLKPFSWVSNKEKLERAKGLLGPEASEDAIKAKYVELGGLLVPEYEIPEASPVSEKKPTKKVAKKK